jgi:hypothetical protein
MKSTVTIDLAPLTDAELRRLKRLVPSTAVRVDTELMLRKFRLSFAEEQKEAS